MPSPALSLLCRAVPCCAVLCRTVPPSHPHTPSKIAGKEHYDIYKFIYTITMQEKREDNGRRVNATGKDRMRQDRMRQDRIRNHCGTGLLRHATRYMSQVHHVTF